MATPSCLPVNDDAFGPVIQGCRSNFDFTLLFEQTILSIGPATLLLIFAPPRVVRLLRSTKKTRSSRLRLYKTVLPSRSLFGIKLMVTVCLHLLDWHSIGLIDLLVQESAYSSSSPLRYPLIFRWNCDPPLVPP
jgi:hypothetical protein